jgi:hypothetical protein
MEPEDYAKAQSLLKHLCEQPESSPFLNPFDFRSLGLHDYPYIIKLPMDLSMISFKLKQKIYQSLDDFLSDIILIIDNCRLYYSPEAMIVEQATALESCMVHYCTLQRLSLENSSMRRKINENNDFASFDEKTKLLELMKSIDSKRLGILVDIIETECPQAISEGKDETLQIRIDALDKSTFSRIQEMIIE